MGQYYVSGYVNEPESFNFEKHDISRDSIKGLEAGTVGEFIHNDVDIDLEISEGGRLCFSAILESDTEDNAIAQVIETMETEVSIMYSCKQETLSPDGN